mgnify:FL=1
MAAPKKHLLACFPLLALLLASCGCGLLRPRPEGVEAQNLVFQAKKQLSDISLQEGEDTSMVLWHKTEQQGIYILQVARDAKLTHRYHAGQSLTLLCLQGKAIVEIEATRYAIEPPSAAFAPSHAHHTAVPNHPAQDLAALAVFAPPYDPDDVVLSEDD